MWQCAGYTEGVCCILHQHLLHLKALMVCQDRLPALRLTLFHIIRLAVITQAELPGSTSEPSTYRR